IEVGCRIARGSPGPEHARGAAVVLMPEPDSELDPYELREARGVVSERGRIVGDGGVRAAESERARAHRGLTGGVQGFAREVVAIEIRIEVGARDRGHEDERGDRGCGTRSSHGFGFGRSFGSDWLCELPDDGSAGGGAAGAAAAGAPFAFGGGLD